MIKRRIIGKLLLQNGRVWAIIAQVECFRRKAGSRKEVCNMLDINMLRKTPEIVRENMKKKFQEN